MRNLTFFMALAVLLLIAAPATAQCASGACSRSIVVSRPVAPARFIGPVRLLRHARPIRRLASARPLRRIARFAIRPLRIFRRCR